MVFFFLLVLSVLYQCKKLNLKWIAFCSFILLFTLISFKPALMYLPMMIFRIIIVYHFSGVFLKNVFNNNEVNLYYLLLLFYEFTVILKFFELIYSFYTAVFYFYLSTAVEIIVCIYFIFFNIENSPRFKLNK
jgi:hypothetical protein